MSLRIFVFPMMLLGLLLQPGLARAAVSCGTVITPVAFGDVAPLSGTTYGADGAIEIRCEVIGTPPLSGQVNASISISQGNSNSYSTRKLFSVSGAVNATGQIDYNLYTDGTRTVIWGDGTSGNSVVNIPVTGLTFDGAKKDVSRIVFGKLPVISNGKKSGLYSDALTVLVSF